MQFSRYNMSSTRTYWLSQYFLGSIECIEMQPIVTDVRSASVSQLVRHECTDWPRKVKPTWDSTSLCRVIRYSLCQITLASCSWHLSVAAWFRFFLQAPQWPCAVRKWLSRDHCCHERLKPGCRIVGSSTREKLTTEPTSSFLSIDSKALVSPYTSIYDFKIGKSRKA